MIFQKILSYLVIGALVLSCSAKTNFDTVGKEMVVIMQNGHYAKLSFDDDMSKRILNDYIDFLDPQHLYFTQPQVDAIRAEYGTEIDNLVFKDKATVPAMEVFNIFYERLQQRVDFTLNLLGEKSFDFQTDESIEIDREESPWPLSEKEAEDLWTLHAKEQVLSEILRRKSITTRAEDLNKEVTQYLKNELDPYEKVKKRYERILHTYSESDEEDIANYFLSTIAMAYDPHSDYYSKRETDDFRSSIANALVGIGALLSAEDDGATKIKGLVINGPADKQGELQLEDRIIGVDSLADGNMIDILYMPLNKVVSHIRGKENTKVTLKVESANGAQGQTKLITIARETVELGEKMVKGEIYEFAPTDGSSKPTKLGWMLIPSFYKDFQEDKTSVARDVKAILERMNEEAVDGLIIDLKGNGGGSLDEVQKITGFFTGDGPVVQIKTSLGQTQVKNSYSKEALFTKPVIVHVDKTSASASEILAAALQDYNRAVVIGDHSTFGKGTVQTPMEIKRFMKWFQDGSRAGTVKATIQKFYRVSGGSTQLKGVESDLIIPSIAEALEIGEKYSKNALDYDQIRESEYDKGDRELLQIQKLSEKSLSRIQSNQDFQYIAEDTERTKERMQKNTISLNIDQRQEEIVKAEARRKSRIAEQRARYQNVQELDNDTFKVYRLNLDDLQTHPLPTVKKEDESYMRKSKEALDDLDTTPDYPSDLTPAKRESLSILTDLIKLSVVPETAQR